MRAASFQLIEGGRDKGKIPMSQAQSIWDRARIHGHGFHRIAIADGLPQSDIREAVFMVAAKREADAYQRGMRDGRASLWKVAA
jgi:hypothetical protein